MYTQTSQKRILDDVQEINKCLEEKTPIKARNLLTVMLSTYDGVLLSLGTSMLPTESAIYGKNFGELKNYDNNVYSNLAIIRNKLELFDLKYYKDLDKSIESIKHQPISFDHAKNLVKSWKGLSEKDKDLIKDRIFLMETIINDDKLDQEAKWKQLKPILDWVSSISVEMGLLILELALKIS